MNVKNAVRTLPDRYFKLVKQFPLVHIPRLSGRLLTRLIVAGTRRNTPCRAPPRPNTTSTGAWAWRNCP